MATGRPAVLELPHRVPLQLVQPQLLPHLNLAQLTALLSLSHTRPLVTELTRLHFRSRAAAASIHAWQRLWQSTSHRQPKYPVGSWAATEWQARCAPALKQTASKSALIVDCACRLKCRLGFRRHANAVAVLQHAVACVKQLRTNNRWRSKPGSTRSLVSFYLHIVLPYPLLHVVLVITLAHLHRYGEGSTQ